MGADTDVREPVVDRRKQVERYLLGSEFEQRDAHRPAIPQAVKKAVYERDGGACVNCGAVADLQFDHIIPISKGGGSSAENVQILCGSCNRGKATRIE